MSRDFLRHASFPTLPRGLEHTVGPDWLDADGHMLADDAGLLIGGLAMLALTLAWPRYFYPFVWGAVYLILEPLNVWQGRHHSFEQLQHGDWRSLAALSFGALLCGFFWEFWNFHSYPKWVYHTPGVEFLHLFEMPLPGYLGYIFFAWELSALRNLVWREAPALRI